MTLPKGTRLGPYEVVNVLGAGGMGEVYRARDARLGRDVAIKVLPSEFAADPARLERFEREARAASALSDPHIVAVYDIGTENGVSYIVTELIEGSDLRAVLDRGAPGVRRTLDLAVQIADGLAAAHEKGIVHRDLKPENILVTEKGLAKIADFGLAKLTDPVSGVSQLPTAAGQSTQTGTIMGTVGYMSPEQANGRTVDFRSDQFSLGAILYEMATGRRAFHRGSPVLTLAAILQDEPEPAGTVNPAIPAPFRWVIDRCLTKEPQGRYSATRDLARELQNIRDHISEASFSVAPGELVAPKRRRLTTAAVIGALALAASAFFLLWLARSRGAPAPRFSSLTFRQGLIPSARFTPDGQTIIYGASWEGRPAELYALRPPAFESRRLDLPNASILAISSTGEMAISEGCRFNLHGEHACLGTLAEAPIDGRTPRELLERVHQADWSPDGKTMAIVRDDEKGGRSLEYPPGKVLYHSAGWIGQPRISPDGRLIAFWDLPAERTGTVSVLDLQGHKRVLVAGWEHCSGLAWSPSGEIWFTPLRERDDGGLYAVSVSGRQRLVYRSPVTMRLHDISASGALLVTVDRVRGGLSVASPPDFRERDLSWLSMTVARDLSRDGKSLLFQENGPESPGIYLRRTDGTSDAVPLGAAPGLSLSADGKWVLAFRSAPAVHLTLLPTGPGGEKNLPSGKFADFESARFFPDGSTILIEGNERGRSRRCYSQRIDGGDAKPLTPEGTEACLLSTDGKFVLAADGDGKYAEYPVGGGAARPISGIEKGEFPIQWGSDDRSLVLRSGTSPVKLERLDLATGRKTPVREVSPADPAGILEIRDVLITPSGQSYAYSYIRMLSNLCLVEGLK